MKPSTDHLKTGTKESCWLHRSARTKGHGQQTLGCHGSFVSTGPLLNHLLSAVRDQIITNKTPQQKKKIHTNLTRKLSFECLNLRIFSSAGPLATRTGLFVLEQAKAAISFASM